MGDPLMRKFLAGLLLAAASLAIGGNNSGWTNSGGSLSTQAKSLAVTAVAGGAPSITQTGTGFGTKASLTPLFWQRFDTTTTGQDERAAGYADMRAYQTGSFTSVSVDMALGPQAGFGALKFLTGAGDVNRESFPHIAIRGLNTPELYHSFWFKISRTVSGSATAAFQIKGPRAGHGASYGDDPKITSSFYPTADLTAYDYTNLSWRDSSHIELGSIGGQADDNDQFPIPAYKTGFDFSGWNVIETWEKMNTVGSANGFQRVSINGSSVTGMITTAENIQPQLNSGENFNYLYLIPGVDLPFTDSSQYQLLFSEHYVDSTPQRVVLCNASTWAACTKRIPLAITAWSDTSVTATMRKVPWATTGQTGVVWSFVVNASNTADSGVARTAY